MEISKKSILASIEFIEMIRQKVMNDTTVVEYKMEKFRECVLGVHYFDGDFWLSQTYDVAGKILGWDKELVEKRFSDSWCTPFEGQKSDYYNEYEWKAIRLFTSAIGFIVDKETWLKLSNDTIIELAIAHDEM